MSAIQKTASGKPEGIIKAAMILPDRGEQSFPPQTARDLLEWVFDRYYDRLLRYCARRLFVQAVAEDMVSSVFLRLVQEVERFVGTDEIKIRNWLYGAANNAINAHIRSHEVRRRILSEVAREQEAGLDGGEDTSSRLDWPILYEAIFRLKRTYQNAVVLRFFEGLSHDEMADVMKMTPGHVRVTLSRAVERLRQDLHVPFCGEPGLA